MKIETVLIKVSTACISVVAGLKLTTLAGKGIEKIIHR